MTTAIYSLSISAEAVLGMHSLNNEGGEGNQIQTRMVNIVDAKGRHGQHRRREGPTA
jgi:CRISPR-associated protein Cst2